MSIVAIIGDCTTTTSVALASAWPVDDEVVIAEVDRTGGSLAAWLDTPVTPSLSTIVANAPGFSTSPDAAWSTIESMVHRSASGIRFIAAPVRSREANRALGEANVTLFPLLGALTAPTVLADLGHHAAVDSTPAVVLHASDLVVVHRQTASSPAAASVRLERLAELIETLVPLGVPIVLAVIGDRPFDIDEIERFVSAEGRHELTVFGLAEDPLSAAVFAGHSGVSAKRIGRLPLMRSARTVVRHLRPGIAGPDISSPDISSPEISSSDAAWLDQLGASS